MNYEIKAYTGIKIPISNFDLDEYDLIGHFKKSFPFVREHLSFTTLDDHLMIYIKRIYKSELCYYSGWITIDSPNENEIEMLKELHEKIVDNNEGFQPIVHTSITYVGKKNNPRDHIFFVDYSSIINRENFTGYTEQEIRNIPVSDYEEMTYGPYQSTVWEYFNKKYRRFKDCLYLYPAPKTNYFRIATKKRLTREYTIYPEKTTLLGNIKNISSYSITKLLEITSKNLPVEREPDIVKEKCLGTSIEFDYDYFTPTEEESKMFEHISEDLTDKKIEPSIRILFDHAY